MTCLYCGVTPAETATHCAFCGQRFPTPFNNRKILMRVAITVLVPLLAYFVMTRLLA